MQIGSTGIKDFPGKIIKKAKWVRVGSKKKRLRREVERGEGRKGSWWD